MFRTRTTLCLTTLVLLALPIHAADTTNVLEGGIAINEILADPNSGGDNCDADSNGTANTEDEYVELYNLSGGSIDISGWELWDAGQGLWFTFPPATVVASGGFAVVLVDVQTGGTLPTVAAGSFAFDANVSGTINNGGDNVVLYDPNNDEFIQARYNGDAADDPTTYAGFSGTATLVGSVEDFGNDADGNSMARNPDGDTNIEIHGNITSCTVCSPGTAVCGPVPVELQTFSIE